MEATDCGDYRLGLGVYALGRLPGTEAAELRAHLRGCRRCRVELDELRGVAEMLARSVPEWRATAGQPQARPGQAGQGGPGWQARTRRGAGRGTRTGASRIGLSGAFACDARGRGRSR
ncbi:zf-HC2 domain-containing protein [Actinomadura fibrosa]|uniref:Zf-HC2 domain-containing protein n=1 Tax=Actinomadura fibrosa TaxID=111802 RepID=A0ABW2XPV8_9ACTN|nr:zf-HC2 domain-containing protein [Actinomadura fibrosa]